MDPVSAIIGIASGAAGLVALTGQVVTYLVGLRDSHKNAELTILDLMSTCQAYRTAWSHIERWASQDSNHAQLQDSVSTVSELKTFLEAGEIIMNLIRSDIDRLLPKRSIWQMASKRRSRDTVRLLLHEKAIAEHAARIHRQNTSLNLLISVLTLPSRPLQEAAIEVLRPKFRKDEETAWTIVNTHFSPASRQWGRTLSSSRGSFELSVGVDRCNEYGGIVKGFSFEDDLFSGPVYKRLLISKLCEQPLGEVATNRVWRTISNPGRNSERASRETAIPTGFRRDGRQNRDIQVTRETAAIEPVLEAALHHNIHEDDTLALELRQQGIFSRSVHEDFCEFVGRYRPRRMQRRHLPLALVLIQNRISADEQFYLNGQFHSAIRLCDLDGAAKALDAGAEINCHQDGQTALDFCVQKWLETKAVDPDLPSKYTTMAEFLMLYKETCVTYVFSCRTTILHLCMHIGATAEFMEPFFEIESPGKALGRQDRFGRTILHTATLASTSGLFALGQINKLYGSVPTDRITDRAGVNTRAFSQSRKAYEHLSILVELAEGLVEKEKNNRSESKRCLETTTTGN